MKSSGGVLDEQVLEVCPDSFGMSLDESHVFAGGRMRLRLGSHRNLRADRVLEAGVQALVWPLLADRAPDRLLLLRAEDSTLAWVATALGRPQRRNPATPLSYRSIPRLTAG